MSNGFNRRLEQSLMNLKLKIWH